MTKYKVRVKEPLDDYWADLPYIFTSEEHAEHFAYGVSIGAKLYRKKVLTRVVKENNGEGD